MRALENMKPKVRAAKKVQCFFCSHAIARTFCVICKKGLCLRHTILDTNDGNTYCREHKQGWQ